MSVCLALEAPAVKGNIYGRRSPPHGDGIVKADYRAASSHGRHRNPIRIAFAALAASWGRETAGMSSLSDMFSSPAYQAIIALGPVVVPHIIDSLRVSPDFWFFALNQITSADPVPEDDNGDVDLMTDAWLRWADDNGY